MNTAGFKVVYNGEDYMAVASQDHSYITVYKGNEKVMLLNPARVQGMFWNGTPKKITLEVAVMQAYSWIYMERPCKNTLTVL